MTTDPKSSFESSEFSKEHNPPPPAYNTATDIAASACSEETLQTQIDTLRVNPEKFPLSHLSASQSPVLVPGYATSHETTLHVRVYNKAQRRVTAKDGQGSEFFNVEGPAPFSSLSWRRKVFDTAKGNAHVFDFHHHGMRLASWKAEVAGREAASFEFVKLWSLSFKDMAIKGTVHHQQGGGSGSEDVELVMRPMDKFGEYTSIMAADGAVLGIIIRRLDERLMELSEWDVRIAPGADMCLMMAFTLLRAQLSRGWRSTYFGA
ncbi:hypothetical protein BD289DRAFT_192520 [Coniella lustricola]|uniref:Tubby C-terminal-like domain-containing protein n=1 Tax=Coniella lustricola TaxID=2025994 RepID=A0A2T3AM45_9PEZI|nr:hypothetical protein BD289DRAFT_192520 [Coniella lustricola]